jgi:alpha-1,6-mannosyltransferase
LPGKASILIAARRIEPQILIAVIAIVALESVFAAMARLGDLSIHIPEFMALALGAGVLYVVALFALEHTHDSRAAFWLILLGALVFRLTLFPYPPSLSSDVHRYRWDGHVQNEGWNPYALNPTDPRVASLRDPGWYGMPAPEIPTMYPPLSELVFRATWRVLPDPVGFKLPFLLADLAILGMLAGWIRSAGGRFYQIAIYAWNPLVVVEFASSGHNDALAIACVVAALLIIRRFPAMSTLTLTAGAMAKAFPVTLLPLALIRSGWPQKLRGWLALCGSAALGIALVSPYWHAWREFRKMMAYYTVTWRNYHSSVYPVLLWMTGSHSFAGTAGRVIVSCLAVWLAVRKADPTRAAFLLIGTILLVAPNGYSWYFTWIVPLLCFFPSPAWILLTILQFLSYKIFINYRALGVWQFDHFFQWLCYGPFYALLAWEMWRGRKRTTVPAL